MPISSPLGRRQTVAALLTLTFVTGLVDAGQSAFLTTAGISPAAGRY